MSLCGAYLYTQDEVQKAGHLRHLKAVLEDPTATPTCKLCAKKLAKLAKGAADVAAH